MPESAVLPGAPTEPGSEGSLRLVVQRVGGRTRIAELECSGPIQVLRCHYLDSAAPDIASVTIASPSGGVLQGDRLRIAVEVRPGARLMLDTQSATRLYRMPARPALIEARFGVADGGWLEYVPDPYIPFAGSNTTIQTVIVVDVAATVLIGEVVAAGRVARGEIFQMTAFRSNVTAIRPSGELLFTDSTEFLGGEALTDPGMMSNQAALGSLYVLRAEADPEVLRAAIGGQAPPPARAGASTLPNDAGAWLRVIAPDTAGAKAVVDTGRDATRVEALGTASPPSRRP